MRISAMCNVQGAALFGAACICATFMLQNALFAQNTLNVCADTVRSFTPGDGQSSGQGPAFFPMNVFGVPSALASDSTPSTDPRLVCSLGLGGSIVVGFKGRAIIDRPGPDFVIFENAFRYSDKRIYAEPGVVSVSKNGIEWKEFTCNSNTLEGCAGKTPTSGNDPFNLSTSGGDVFDIAGLGLDSIRWISIKDTTRTILQDPSHPSYDPTLSGFDLDAVASPNGVYAPTVSGVYVKPMSTIIEVHVVGNSGELTIYNVLGIRLSTQTLSTGVHFVPTSQFEATCLFVMLVVDNVATTTRVLP